MTTTHSPNRAPRAGLLRRALATLLVWCVAAPCYGVSLALAAPRAVSRTPAQSALKLGGAALAHYRAGRFVVAEQLYLRAWELQPASPEYIYGAGLAARAAGDKARARGYFETVLATTPTGHALRARAERHLAELSVPESAAPAPPVLAEPAPATPTALAAPTGTTATAVPAIAVVANPQFRAPQTVVVGAPAAVPRAPTPIPAWVTLATSGLLFATSSGFAAVAWRDQRDLDGKRLPDGRYDLARVSQAQARSGQQGINDAWTASGVTAGLGVAAFVAGLWLLGNPAEARHPAGASGGTP